MAAADRTTQEKLLRTVYLRKMRRQFNLKSILLQKIARNTETFAQGEKISAPLHTGVSGAWGWSDAGDVPAARYQKHARHEYNYKTMVGAIEIEARFKSDARKGYSAELRPLKNETTGLVKQMRAGLNFDLFGDGTGLLATPTTAASATSITVDSTRGFHKGDMIDVVLKADGTIGTGGAKGLEVSPNHHTGVLSITSGSLNDFADVAANASTYGVYRKNSYEQAIFGLAAIVSESNPSVANLGGIDRSIAGNEFWKGWEFGSSASPRRPSLQLFAEACNAVDQYSDENIDIAICGHNVFSLLVDDLVGNKRFRGSETKLNGWASALMFDDQIPIVRDKHCPPDKIYCLSLGTFQLYQDTEGQWMDEDGAILARKQNRLAYGATWFRQLQLVCDLPSANAVIHNIDYAIPQAA